MPVTTHSDYDNDAAYDQLLGVLTPHKFENSCWGNEAAPSIAFYAPDPSEACVMVFVDYKNESMRECSGKMFSIVAFEYYGGDVLDSWETDDIHQAYLDALDARDLVTGAKNAN